MQTAEGKSTIRKHLLTVLSSIPREQKVAEERSVFDNLIRLDFLEGAEIVLSYLSFGNELDVDGFNARLLEKGASVYVPVIKSGVLKGSRTEELDFRRIGPDFHTLPKNRYGIREPGPGIQTLEFNSKTANSLIPVIVPGLAFDGKCRRLGRGGGFYDRFISSHRSRICTVGVCFSVQKVDEVPADGKDEPVDWLVTAGETIRRDPV